MRWWLWCECLGGIAVFSTGCGRLSSAEGDPLVAIPEPPAQLTSIAGTYVRSGQGLWSDSLTLTPDGHFARDFRGDAGGAIYEGTVEWLGELLRLPRPAGIGTAGVFDSESETTYRVVTWGERTYLVEDAELLRFCNAVNWGREPRSVPGSYFLLRQNDWLKPALGLPAVPEIWQEYLLQVDLDGTVTELGNDGTAWINLGTKDGLCPGLLLWLRDLPTPADVIAMGAPPTRDVTLEIVHLEPERTLVRQEFPRGRLPIAVGMRVTSRVAKQP